LIRHIVLSVLAAALIPSIGMAQEASAPSPDITLAVSGGSLGIGPEVGFRPVSTFGLRASASFLGLSHNVDVNDINYDGDLKLQSYGANVDLYPFQSAFRLSAGFRVDRNKIDLTATPTRSVTIGSTIYTPEQIGTIKGEIRAKKLAPTITVGLAKNRARGFAWSLDAGVMLHGRPKTRRLVTTGQLATNPLFQNDFARERAEIDDEVDNYKVYPIVQLAVGYAF
jgi:hypothetical protein